MPIFRTIIRTTRGVGRAIKDINRLRQILQVLMRHGFGYLVGHVMLGGAIAYQAGLVPTENAGFFTRARRSVAQFFGSAADLLTTILGAFGLWKRGRRPSEPAEMKVRARRAVVDLGPGFVKIGQILSTRPDLIPADWCEEFSTLQDRVAPLDIEVIIKEISLSCPEHAEELIQSLDPEPLASASIAQVHRATLPDGSDVVLKVRRPGVHKQIAADIDMLEFIAGAVEAQFPEARVVDMPGILKELEKSVRAETDFLVEAGNTERLRENFVGFEGIVIPDIYREYTSSAVLTMEFLEGIPIRDARAAGHDMEKLGRIYLKSAFKMLFDDAFFHGDLHPGNVLVLEGDQLGLLDFGMVGRMSEDMKDHIVAIVVAMQRRDFRSIARIFYEIGIKEAPVNYALFEQDVMEIMDKSLVGKAMADIEIGGFLRELASGAVRHQVRMTPAFTMFLKALITTEGLAKTLIPELNPLGEMEPYLESLAARRFGKERIQRDLLTMFVSFSGVMNRMPAVVTQFMDDYQANRIQLPIVMQTPPEELELRNRSTNRIILAMITVGLVLGSSVALMDDSLRPFGIPLLPMFGFGLAFSTWSILLWGIWRSGRV